MPSPKGASGLIVALGLLAPLSQAVEPEPMRAQGSRIANGLNTTAWPTVVSIQQRQQAWHRCSGVLVGCRTVLSAAHCYCGSSTGDDGARCQPNDERGFTIEPAELEVFFHNAPPVGVAAIAVPVDYEFGTRSDLALLRLSAPVSGIQPASLNTQNKPPIGTSGTLVGYGQSDQRIIDYGIKRQGQVTLADCAGVVPNDQHLCWNFPGLDAAGEPGSDSNTCPGDSGGPLFMDMGAGITVAGITSGGSSQCQQADIAFDADVHPNLAWLNAQLLGDNTSDCSTLAPVGEVGATVFTAQGSLSFSITEARYSFSVDTDTRYLRVALNGNDTVNLDLFLYAPDDPDNPRCQSTQAGVFEFCEVGLPRAGVWEVWVINTSRENSEFQVVSTLFDDTALLLRDGFETH